MGGVMSSPYFWGAAPFIVALIALIVYAIYSGAKNEDKEPTIEPFRRRNNNIRRNR